MPPNYAIMPSVIVSIYFLEVIQTEASMNIEALEKVGDYFKEKELDIALLSNPATIAWLTGYAPSNQIGTNPFEGGPALGWWHAGKLTLVLSDAESTAAQAQGIETRDYLSYTIESPAAGFLNQGLVLKNLLKESGNLKGHCGVEFNFLPAALLEIIKDSLPLVSLAPLDGSFDQLRAIKTAREIELLRASLRICDLAQFETRRLIQPGISEIELWDRVKCQRGTLSSLILCRA
ncbi:MAG: aminopeptidase P family N-terminal domain-containing protein [Chloroflexi bacterium]|nr:aminopeptidase P family N-terminal domain-containing protein [Chloroflexota bacterium]